MTNPIYDEQRKENLRQEKEAFDQHKDQQAKWFNLRLYMGYLSLILLPSFLILSAYILFRHTQFPSEVVKTAAGALFVDVLGLVICVWKIVLNPKLMTKLAPITSGAVSDMKKETTPIDDTTKTFQVLSAIYGTQEHTKEVTERIKTKIVNNRLNIIVDNSTMGGDPHPTKRKRLQLTYCWNGETITTSFTERDTIDLP